MIFILGIGFDNSSIHIFKESFVEDMLGNCDEKNLMRV